MTQKEYQELSNTIPHQPGIYKYFDIANELLYVGKAKDLRKRTGSYFSKTLTNYKTHELVHRIVHIEFTITNNEQDAFFFRECLNQTIQTEI